MDKFLERQKLPTQDETNSQVALYLWKKYNLYLDAFLSERPRWLPWWTLLCLRKRHHHQPIMVNSTQHRSGCPAWLAVTETKLEPRRQVPPAYQSSNTARLAKRTTNKKTGRAPCPRGGGGAGALRPAAGNIRGRPPWGASWQLRFGLVYLF